MSNKPIKRVEALQPLSRDHHHGLLLSWKIRKGFANNVAPERMKKYVTWFFETQLVPHFKLEEQYVFPILPRNHELVHRALAEHRRLIRLNEEDEDLHRTLAIIEEELEQHIRFEERVLFNEIQKVASPMQLQQIAAIHADERFKENTADEFWK